MYSLMIIVQHSLYISPVYKFTVSLQRLEGGERSKHFTWQVCDGIVVEVPAETTPTCLTSV